MSYDVDAINKLIKNRRSVFPDQFAAGKKVDDAFVWQIIENGTWAPTHSQTEPWQFVVFTGEGLKKLADFQGELYKAEAGDQFNEKKYNKLKTQPLLASHILAICMKRSAGPGK